MLMPSGRLGRCLYMNQKRLTPSGKPYDIHERSLEFACDIVNAVQFLHTRGPVARAFSYQLLAAGTSAGAKNLIAGGNATGTDDRYTTTLKESNRFYRSALPGSIVLVA